MLDARVIAKYRDLATWHWDGIFAIAFQGSKRNMLRIQMQINFDWRIQRFVETDQIYPKRTHIREENKLNGLHVLICFVTQSMSIQKCIFENVIKMKIIFIAQILLKTFFHLFFDENWINSSKNDESIDRPNHTYFKLKSTYRSCIACTFYFPLVVENDLSCPMYTADSKHKQPRP